LLDHAKAALEPDLMGRIGRLVGIIHPDQVSGKQADLAVEQPLGGSKGNERALGEESWPLPVLVDACLGTLLYATYVNVIVTLKLSRDMFDCFAFRLPTNLRALGTASYYLAEGPIWDSQTSTVSWVDIEEGLILSAPYDGRLGQSVLRSHRGRSRSSRPL
jgi:hypothetical protein